MKNVDSATNDLYMRTNNQIADFCMHRVVHYQYYIIHAV